MKKAPFKVRDKDNEDGICTCGVQNEITPECVEIGICPSLKICAVFDGYRIGIAGLRELKDKIRKEKGGLREDLAF